MDNLTVKQAEVLAYLKEYILKKSYPPSVREICQAATRPTTGTCVSSLRVGLNSSSRISIVRGFAGSRLI